MNAEEVGKSLEMDARRAMMLVGYGIDEAFAIIEGHRQHAYDMGHDEDEAQRFGEIVGVMLTKWSCSVEYAQSFASQILGGECTNEALFFASAYTEAIRRGCDEGFAELIAFYAGVERENTGAEFSFSKCKKLAKRHLDYLKQLPAWVVNPAHREGYAQERMSGATHEEAIALVREEVGI